MGSEDGSSIQKSSSGGGGIKVSQFVESSFAQFGGNPSNNTSSPHVLTPSYVFQKAAKSCGEASNTGDSISATSNNQEVDIVEENDRQSKKSSSEYLLPHRVIVLLLILHDLSEIIYVSLRWIKIVIIDKTVVFLTQYLRLCYDVIPENIRKEIAIEMDLGVWATRYYAFMGSKNSPPPLLAAIAILTLMALIVHPDGFTWVILGKMRDCIWDTMMSLHTVASNVKDGKIPGLFASENFVGFIMLILMILYVHNVITSDHEQNGKTRQRTKSRSGKKGKHKNRSRNHAPGGKVKHGQRSGTYHSNNQSTSSQHASTSTVLSPTINEGKVQDIPSSAILDVCPGRKNSFDSGDNLSDVSSSLNSCHVVGNESSASFQSSTFNEVSELSIVQKGIHKEDKRSGHSNRQSRSLSEDNRVYEIGEKDVGRTRTKHDFTKSDGSIKHSTEPETLKRNVSLCRDDHARRWPSSSSPSPAIHMLQKKGQGRRRQDFSTFPKARVYDRSKRLDSLSQVSRPRKHSKAGRSSRDSLSYRSEEGSFPSHGREFDKGNVSADKQTAPIRYTPPKYATYSVDRRYSPGKIELASFLAQAGLVGVDCAQLLADLSGVNALSYFNDKDFERYRVDVDKRLRIKALLEARRAASFGMLNSNFDILDQSLSRPASSGDRIGYNWDSTVSPTSELQSMQGFKELKSHEDQRYDGDPSSNFSRVIGSRSSSHQLHSYSSRLNETEGGWQAQQSYQYPVVVSPRAMEDGLQRYVDDNQQYQYSSRNGVDLQDERNIEAEMSALGDQMVGSLFQ